MKFPPIETDRLFLRVLADSDAREVFTHFSDPDVMCYISDTEPCKTLADAQAIIAFHQNDTGCRYGLFHKPTMKFIGTAGFHCWNPEPPFPSAEVGYDLAPDYWGQGFIREAMTGLLRLGFESMELCRIVASTAPNNVRSHALLRRLGFDEDDRTQATEDIWFSLRLENWRSTPA